MTRRSRILFLMLMAAVLSASTKAWAGELEDISQNITSTPDLIAKGKTIFTSNCTSCHGAEGKGDGPAAAAFNPKPRNFTAEKFKQGSSPSATFYTVTNGLGSMPSFASLPVAERFAVIHYVLSLSPNIEKDSAATLAKIGLDPAGKPLSGFGGDKLPELPIDFIVERMASDGNIQSLDYKALAKGMEDIKAEAEKRRLAAAPVIIKPDLERGKVVYTYCTACHGANGEGSKLVGAPQIAGQDADYLITQLHHFQNGARGAHPNDVSGLKMRPMARLLRMEDDLVSVANYVSKLNPTQSDMTLEGDAAKGAAAYGVCMACHGADAKGVKAMNAPSLRHLPDWYVLAQIQKFKGGLRAYDSRDVNGATMKGMAMGVDDEGLKNILAYIRTLK